MSSLPTQLYDGLIVGQYPTGWYNASGSFYAKTVSVAADRYTLLSPIQIQADVGLPGSSVSLSQSSQTTLDLSVATNWASTSPTDYTVAGNRAGKDFYVYGCVPTSGSIIKLVLSSNGSTPTGYTTANSRLLGGFHCLCVAAGTISSHPASGYVAGDIIPNSVWDLNWYAESGIQQGMALDNEINQWVYIYPARDNSSATKRLWRNCNCIGKLDGCDRCRKSSKDEITLGWRISIISRSVKRRNKRKWWRKSCYGWWS